jgi:hypothetical protein
MRDLIQDAIMELREAQCSDSQDKHIDAAVKILTRVMELIRKEDEKNIEVEVAVSQELVYSPEKSEER